MSEEKQMRVIPRGKPMKEKIGLGQWSVDELVRRDPTFPRPIKVGLKRVGFLEPEVDKWLLQKQQEALDLALAKTTNIGRPRKSAVTK